MTKSTWGSLRKRVSFLAIAMQPVTPMIERLLRGSAQLAEFTHDFALCQVADGAGIKNEKIGILFIVDPCQGPVFRAGRP